MQSIFTRSHLRHHANLFRTSFCLHVLALVLGASSLVSAQSASPRYLEDIKALTAPEMDGRGDDSQGLMRAAKLIEARFKSLGLEPAGKGSYFQPFTVITGATIKPDTYLHVESAAGKATLKLKQDFVPFSFSSSTQAAGPVVFAGYGITANEAGYDDYAGLDVKNKIVVILRYQPPDFAAKSFNAGINQPADLITKAINARNHGALAVVLVNGKRDQGEEDLLVRSGMTDGPRDAGIMFVQAKNDVAANWFQQAGKSLAEVQEEINKTGKPASFAFPDTLHLSLKVDKEDKQATLNNVLAYLPGQTDEYIILGAHYDHLGRGYYYGSLAPARIGEIHPGADDNASGTAGVLELARRLAPLKGKLHRGILFASFAGEELGLLGSAKWVEEPTRPVDKAVAMLNMDMIGRIQDDKVYIGGVGTGTTFKAALDQAMPKSGFKVEYSATGYSSSDHTSFLPKHIPVLFFFSGLHSDYHKPSDTWEKINAGAAMRLLDLVENVSSQIASAPERPAFSNVVETRTTTAGSSSGSGYGAYFGSIPDFGQVENGVKFSDVKPGSPAAKAGLKAGDILVQFGSQQIKNLYDFTDALRRGKPGDVVEVKVMRDGQPVTATVTLEQRK